MNTFSHVPPGFRFHPTDEELVDYYLRKKIASKKIDLDVIKDIDLYKIEPWDLIELCKLGTDDQNDWYFFSHKDKKYPTGTRTNRATKAGFWKATGRDKAIYTKHCLIGMRKTLVFYQGRAPNGQKSDWIMHEYRLETNENGISSEEGWVVCRVFKKRMTTMQKMGEYHYHHDQSQCWYDDQVSSLMPSSDPIISHPNYPSYHHPCKPELELQYINNIIVPPHPPHDASFLQLPQLESPKLVPSMQFSSSQPIQYFHPQSLHYDQLADNNNVTDWRVLDKFVASQLQDDAPNKDTSTTSYSNAAILRVAQQITLLANGSKRADNNINNNSDDQEEHASTNSTSSCQMELWK